MLSSIILSKDSAKKRGYYNYVPNMLQYNYNIMWPSGPILIEKINLSRHSEIHKSHLHHSPHTTPPPSHQL